MVQRIGHPLVSIIGQQVPMLPEEIGGELFNTAKLRRGDELLVVSDSNGTLSKSVAIHLVMCRFSQITQPLHRWGRDSQNNVYLFIG